MSDINFVIAMWWYPERVTSTRTYIQSPAIHVIIIINSNSAVVKPQQSDKEEHLLTNFSLP